MSDASLWVPGTTPLLDGLEKIEIQRLVATAGQQLFTITNFEYAVGNHSLLVFRDGQILALDVDFHEVSSTSFSVVIPATANQIYYVLGFTAIQDSTAEAIAAAVAATAALVELSKIYLGPKAADPTVDNLGNPLIDGAIYFNSIANVLKIYSIATGLWQPGVTTVGGVLLAASNLADLANKNTARTNLGVNVIQTTVTFTAARISASITINDASILTTSKIDAWVQGKQGDTIGDEMMEAFSCTGQCLVDGTMILRVNCLTGFAQGTYNVNYTVQN